MKEELLELLKLAGANKVKSPIDAMTAMIKANNLVDQIKDNYSVPSDVFDLLDEEMRACLVVAALTGVVAMVAEATK